MYGFKGVAYPGFSNALVHNFVAKSVPVVEALIEVHLYLLPTGLFEATMNGVVQGDDFDKQDLIRAFSYGSDTDFDLWCSISHGHIASLSFNGERISI